MVSNCTFTALKKLECVRLFGENRCIDYREPEITADPLKICYNEKNPGLKEVCRILAMYMIAADDEDGIRKFEFLFNSYSRQMLSAAYAVLGNRDDAEDAVQDALIRIAERIDALDMTDKARVRRYVLTAAENSAKNMLRKESRRPKTVCIDDFYSLEDENSLFAEIDSGKYDEIVGYIMGLDDTYRDVLYLKFAENMSVKEISSLLGRKYSTVKTQVKRGETLLAKKLREKGVV